MSTTQAVLSLLLTGLGAAMLLIGWGTASGTMGALLLAVSLAAFVYFLVVRRRRGSR